MNKPHLRYKNQTPKERTWTIHFLAIVKFVKGFLLLIVALKLLTLINKDVDVVFTEFIARHRIDPENKIVHLILEKITGLGNAELIAFSVGSFLYSALQLTEGVGLWLQKRWAEVLTVVATSLLVPVEIYEIYEKVTLIRIGALLLNLFVVWYLATRLRDERKEEIMKELTSS
jgi:uncharacterized membrane protein (DUF2068 family)